MTAADRGAVTRDGRMYSVAVMPLDRPVADALRWATEAGDVDPALRTLGSAHLAQLREATPALFDGPVVRWLRTDGDTVVVAPGSYFDMLATCDAVRAQGSPDGPLWRAVQALTPDPLTSGAGRCAAMGVTVVLARGGSDRARSFLIGLRSGRVATDAGRWHAVPSGMVEPDQDGQPLAASIVAELAEEAGVRLTVEAVSERGRVIGLAQDLMGLRPDVVVLLPVAEPEWASRAAPSDPEMSEFRWVPMTADGIAGFWQQFGPDAVTAPLAGAVALLELKLGFTGGS